MLFYFACHKHELKTSIIVLCHKTFTAKHQADEKALEETGDIPESIKKLAAKAKDACERLLKDGSKLVASKDLQPVVKEGYKTLSCDITNLQNLLMFGELPERATVNRVSLENFIGGIAQDVEKYNLEIQAAKARAKAKS